MNKLKKRLTSLLCRHYYLLTALLLFMSFPSFDFVLFKGFPLFGWFCLVPLFLAVRNRGYTQLYIMSFFTMLLGALFTWGWMGTFGGDTISGHLVIWSLLLPCIAFLLSGRILVAEFLSRRYPNMRVFIYPAVWLAGDLLQSLGYLAFPWNYLGYSQYPVLPLVQASSVIGILGVSFLVVSGNSIITEFISRNKENIRARSFKVRAFTWKRIPAAFLLLIVIIIAAGTVRLYNGIPKTERRISIATVQSCISPWADWERLKYMKLAEILSLSNTVIASKPDLLIWSESATLEPISFRSRIGQPDRFDKQILEYARVNNTPILTGEIGVVEDRKRMLGFPQNSAVLINSSGSVEAAYAKIHLCPFGEWFPYGDLLPWVRDIALQMGGSDFVPGKEPVRFFSGGAHFGVLICYEGMFYRLPVHYKRAGADFLVNITNDGWSGSYGGHFQHFAAAPFRAAENGIWFVRVGNDGYSALLDPLGRTTRSIPILEKGVMTAEIRPDSRIETVYSRVADLFSYCILGILALLCALSEIRLFIRKWKGQS